MKKLLTLLSFSSIVCCHFVGAQSTGINNVLPNKYAALDIQSAGTLNQGILIPRLKANAKSSFGYGSSEQGMIIYGADTDSLYYWTGYSWRTLQPASAPPSGPWTKTSTNVELTTPSDNVGIGVLPAGTKLEIRGADASPTYLALRITNSLANTLMTVSNAGDIAFPTLAGPGNVLADGNGKLTLNKSAFRAYIPTNQNMNGVTQVANFTSEVFDINGDYDPTAKQFTAPAAGIYNFSWCVYFYSVAPANAYCYARLMVNGGVVDYGLVVAGGLYDPVRGNRTIKLNAGDKVSISANAPSGELSSLNYYSDFSGFRVF